MEKRSINKFTRTDIDKAVMFLRGFDKRTLDAWFSALFKLDYIVQPEPGLFSLNYEKVAELDLKVPPSIDVNQTKLTRFKE